MQNQIFTYNLTHNLMRFWIQLRHFITTGQYLSVELEKDIVALIVSVISVYNPVCRIVVMLNIWIKINWYPKQSF